MPQTVEKIRSKMKVCTISSIITSRRVMVADDVQRLGLVKGSLDRHGQPNAIAMVRDAIGMVRAGRAQVSADSKAGAGLVGV